MPAGVPVATVAVGGARNAGLLAVRILAAADEGLRARMQAFQASLQATVLEKDAALRQRAMLAPALAQMSRVRTQVRPVCRLDKRCAGATNLRGAARRRT